MLTTRTLEPASPYPLSRWLYAGVVVISGAGLLFVNSVRFPLPVGYAGLYAQMAGQIAANGFRIPQETPFYGPGGVPFAYPPLGLYAMALGLKLGVPPFFYMRFVPPLLSVLALIPIYLVVEHLTGSRLAGTLASLLMVFSPLLYDAHATAAGVVRALAFLSMFWGARLALLAAARDSKGLAALTGIFLGLTVLTHLAYGAFLVLWLICFWVVRPSRDSLRLLTVVGAVGVLVSAPWVGMILSRYGPGPLLYAVGSHENREVLQLVLQPAVLLTRLGSKFWWLDTNPLFGLYLAAGAVYFGWKRRLDLVLLFVLTLLVLSAESPRFLIVLGSILAGAGSLLGVALLPSRKWVHGLWYGGAAAMLIQAGIVGIPEILQASPKLHESVFPLARYVQQHTTSGTRYLLVARHDESEWFPYLLQREPALALWGSEWLGTYEIQSRLNRRLDHCELTQDLQCIMDLRLGLARSDLLITRKGDTGLTSDLVRAPDCRVVTEIGRYIVWPGSCLSNR